MKMLKDVVSEYLRNVHPPCCYTHYSLGSSSQILRKNSTVHGGNGILIQNNEMPCYYYYMLLLLL